MEKNIIPYKFSQLKNKLSYDEAIKICGNKKLHSGQLKLFYSELLFLTYNYDKNDNQKVLYIGAAEGYHITMLSKLFPELHFDLWDKREFDVNESDKVKIYKRYFLNNDSKKYKNDNILLISDIRDLDIGKNKDDSNKMDKIVMDDMELQKQWCKLIKPKIAFLKFRIPYDKSKFEYLTGTLFIQPYTTISAELRLMTNDYDTFKSYDSDEIDTKMAYFHVNVRCKKNNYKSWSELLIKNKLVNSWDNVFSIFVIKCYLEKINGSFNQEELVKVFLEISDFHIIKYGNRIKNLIYV